MDNMIVRMAPVFLCAIFLMCLFRSVSAFEVSPLIVELAPQSGKGSTQVHVGNTTSAPIAATAAIHELVVEDGMATLGAIDENAFLVLPPALRLEPGQTQVVRLQWIDPLPSSTDRSFVLLIEQVPTGASATDDTGVDVSFSFNVLVHVSVRESSPLLTVSEVSLSDDPDRMTSFLTLSNDGNGNAFGDSIAIYWVGPTSRLLVPPSAVRPVGEHYFIAPGGRLRVQLDLGSLPAMVGGGDQVFVAEAR